MMGRKYSILFILVSIALVLSSCGDVSILTTEEEESHTLEVKSVAHGGTLALGSPVVFSLDSPLEPSPTNLDIKLVDENGIVVASQSIKDPETGRDISLDFPDLNTGRYRIEFALYSEDSVLLEEDLTFFYITGTYLIHGIESFPPVNPPASVVLLKALLEVPEGSDPYVRWKQGGSLLQSGVLSEGIANIYWQAPKDDGVYSISVELFPVPPLKGRDFSFQSDNIMETELYISSSEDQESNVFAPRESYFSLFHLQGDLYDRGNGSADAPLTDATAIGLLEPAVHENILGYRFAAGSGFAVPRFILPVEYEVLQPFTLSVGISLEALTEGARIISIEAEEEQFALDLYIGDDLKPAAVLTVASTSQPLPSEFPELQVNKRYILSLSIQPDPDSQTLTAKWYLDGVAAGATVLEGVGAAGLSNRGTTVVAGEGGFAGILDEIGVYYRDGDGNSSVDPSLF
jgi:hypothetical protein